MFGVDDILLLPMKGLLFACREIHSAAQQQTADQAEAVRTELRELYMMLETDRISEAEFDSREAELLDRLDELESPGREGEEEMGSLLVGDSGDAFPRAR